MRDLTAGKKDYALFLPAVSGFYTEVLGRCRNFPDYLPPDRTPKGFENGMEGLDFFNEEKGYFYYDVGLYSAGHAYLDEERSHKFEWMIQERDRKKVTLLGDSGGYQIGKGVIKFDWEHFFEKKGDPGYVGKADEMRAKILHWLEYTADWSLTLDVPTWAYMEETARERTGLRTFQECLDATLFNLDYFVEHREGKTKFLNVLQGTTWDDANTWYDAVKDYPFEGWAMGGNNMRDIEIALRRLIIMRDEGYLEGKDWIHFLGTSKLEWAVMLTGVQRELRKHVNPNVTVSYDAASPFIAAAHGRIYTYNSMLCDKLSYVMDRGFDGRQLAKSDIPFPFESEIGARMTVGDICTYGPEDLNKLGKITYSAWDSFTYTMLGAHNCYSHIGAVQRINHLSDLESMRFDPDWRTWTKTKRKSKAAEPSFWVPRNLLYFNNFIKELFVSEHPMQMLEDASPLLQEMTNQKYIDGNTALFQDLFGDDSDNEIVTGEDYEREDDVLDALEKELRNED
jgi:hypothetical protein